MSLYKKKYKLGLEYTVNKYILKLKKPTNGITFFYIILIVSIIGFTLLFK